MDFFGILFDIKNGSKMPYSKNYFDTLFAAKLEELGVKTITGTLPLTFTAKAGNVIDWSISGNDDVGENLFDKVKFNNTVYRRACTTSETATGISITATGGDAYVGRAINSGGSAANYESNIISVDSNVSYTIKMSNAPKCYVTYINVNLRSLGYTQLDSTTFTFTTPANATGILLRLGDDTLEVGQTAEFNNIMLVKGSTAPEHYIPYQQGVGERTENLFDCSQVAGDAITVDGYTFTKGSTSYWYDIFSHTAGYGAALQTDKAIKLDAGTYTLSAINITPATLKWNVRYADLNGQNQADVVSNKTLPRTFTLANAGYVSFRLDAGTPTVDRLMLVEGSTAPSTYIPYGYQIPLTVSQTGQPDKNYDIYIGDSPLTEGETVSKTSTGVDLELFEGENTVSTTLYNKPVMEIKYK